MKAKEKTIKQILFVFCILFFGLAYASIRKQSLALTEVSSQSVMISNIFLMIGILLYLCFNLLIYYTNEKDLEIVFQMFLINFLVALFINLAFFNTLSPKTWIAYVELAAFNFLVILYFIGFFMGGNRRKVKIERHHIYISGILLLFIVLSVDTFGITPRWDALVYYDAGFGEYITDIPKKFDLSLNSINALQLQTHYSFGYAFFAAIGEFIGRGKAYGVIIVHLIVVLVAIICFYGILNYFVPKYKKNVNILATCIFAFSPIALGSYFSVCQDYFVLYLFVIMFYLEIKEWHYLGFFVSILFVFTKEPAVIIYCAFVACKWLHRYFPNNRFTVKNVLVFVKKNIYELFISVIPFLLFMLVFWVRHGSYYGHWDTTKNTSFITTASTAEMNCFGFTIENFFVKCKQIFVLNFSWIFVLVIVVALSCFFFRKQKENCIKNRGKLWLFFIPVLSNLLFNFFYLTNWNTRYNVACVMGLYVAGILCIYLLFKSKKVLMIIFTGIIALLLIQNYTSVDMVTNVTFSAKNVGKTVVVDAAHDDSTFMCNDGIVNNKSYIYMETALNRAYRDIASENPLICIDNICGNKELQLWGDYNNNSRTLRWDSEKEKFSFDDSCKKIRLYSVDKKTIKNLYAEKIYYFSVEWDDSQTLQMLKEKYNILDCKTFSYFGWNVKRFYLHKK